MLEQHCILLTKQGCVLCVTHPTQTHPPSQSPCCKNIQSIVGRHFGILFRAEGETGTTARQMENNMEKFHQSIRHEFSFN